MKGAVFRDGVGEPADHTLAEVAAELRLIEHRAGWARTLAIGELILKHFFNSNIREWRTHRHDKEASIRRLAQRGDCPLGRSALRDAVAVYVACKDLPAGAFPDQLSPSHMAAALRVGSSQRAELLQRAIACRWTVHELRVQVSVQRKKGGERRGRPRASPQRAGQTYLKNVALLLTRAGDLLDTADHIEPDVLQRLQAALGQIDEHLQEVRVRLAELSAGSPLTLAATVSRMRTEHGEPRCATG